MCASVRFPYPHYVVTFKSVGEPDYVCLDKASVVWALSCWWIYILGRYQFRIRRCRADLFSSTKYITRCFFTVIQCNPGLRFAHNFFSLSLSFLVLLFLSMVGPQDRTSGNTLVVGDVKQPNTSQLQASKIHPRDVSVNWSLWCDEQLNTDSVKMNSSMLRIVWNQWWENVLCNTHSVTKYKGQSIHFSFLFFVFEWNN